MHMIDVMAKLKEIAESGYDNEDIQRGIDAAATQVFAEEEAEVFEKKPLSNFSALKVPN